MTEEHKQADAPVEDNSWSWVKKLVVGGIISLTVSIGGMFFNSTIVDKRALIARVSETEKTTASLTAKMTEMEKYQSDLIDSMLTEERILNDVKVRISFLERAIGLETYIQYLKTHATLAKQIADSEAGDTPVKTTAPIYEKPKDLSNMLNQELKQTTDQSPPLIDKVKKERFEKHIEGQHKQ